MNQCKVDSFMEQAFNVTTGFILAAITWKWLILNMIAWEWIVITDTLEITGIFSVVSLARGFVIRRLFNGRKPWATIKLFLQTAC